MADALLHAELLAACSALGYSDGVKYHKEADCLETTKDLVRYLRKDDESHEIRRALGETRVLQTDLLPLIRDHSHEGELFDIIIRLLVNLTNPVLLLFREELPEEKVTRQQFLQLITHQQGYKESFIDEKVWSVLVGKLGELLQLEWDVRQEDDKLLIERILILVRNVLSVPASPEEEKRTDDDASVHDQVLWALHLAGFEDLLLYIASSENEQDLCMHVLEIISLMLREQDPSLLAMAGLQRSQSEKEKDDKELLEMRQREALSKQQQKRKYHGARHSRFGGTYYVQNMKSISDRNLISHQPISDIKSINFDRAKCPLKRPKHRLPMRESSTTRRSTLAIRLFLQEFCIEFLNGAYNSIMYIVKDNLNRARAQEHDESYYLWAIKFFMEFNRHHQFKIELVSETLSVQTFHYIQTNLETYYEMMSTDKKKIPIWSRRMHKAVRAYQELLMTLACMDKSPVESVRESSRVLKSKVFYVVEYREMVLILLQNFDQLKMTLTYLKDVVETSHIFLKLLEGFCGKNKHIFVQQKKKPRKKKVILGKAASTELTEDKLQDLWDEISSELSAIVQGEAGELPDTIPFDTLSEQTEDEQKEVAMRKINRLLRNREIAEAVSLMRSSREVWPEGNIFGSQGMDPSDEFLSLREIFMAKLNPVEEPAPEEDYEDEDEEAEEEESLMHISEQEFNFMDFLRRFANTNVMKSYACLIKRYKSNSTYTNYCILKLYHRIAWDCKLPAMFFQASLFCVFQQAMEDPRQNSNESVKEIVKFAKYIFRQFLKVAETNTKVFVELLFYKTNKEAVEIECGYGEQVSGKQAMKFAWKEEEEEELRRLFEEFEGVPPESKEGKDTADLIVENLINQTRTRRMVIKKMKEMGLINDVKQLKQKSLKVQAPRVWTEEEEEELRMLFEENRDAMDIVGRIMDNLVVKRPKHRVIEKIMELGLVADRKALYKKRAKNPKSKVSSKHLGERFIAANQSSDDGNSERESDESDDERERENVSPDVRIVSKKISRKPSDAPPVVTPLLISQALKSVLEANMQEPVDWISKVLKDVADDREEDGDLEPVPILAITEACTDALENESFQKLMKLIGLRPPQSHEEMFWRVPSCLSVVALRKRAHYLVQGMSGNIVDSENAEEPLEPVEDSQETEKTAMEKGKTRESSKSRRAKPKVKSRNPKRSEVVEMDLEDSENVNPEDKENYRPESQSPLGGGGDSQQTLRRARQVNDSSDDDTPILSLTINPSSSSKRKKRNISDDEEIEGNIEKQPMQERKVKKTRLLVMNDDSDDDIEAVDSHNLVLHMDTELTEPNKQASGRDTTLIDSDEEMVGKETSKRLRMVGSDSEDDVPLVGGKPRARAVIESDDE
ncbi:protein timeless homolog [Procambarus clarkii]|uniref:protein timeless homolog n=1 Tax=Procambarus clarkii TaxID=6728 RepID=UPI0037443AA4